MMSDVVLLGTHFSAPSTVYPTLRSLRALVKFRSPIRISHKVAEEAEPVGLAVFILN